MEIFSIITDDKKVFMELDNFIFTFPKLQFYFKDNDTAYFISPISKRNEFYYHYILRNNEDKFNDFSPLEISYIKDIFTTPYIIDLQYRSEEFLDDFIKEFERFLKDKRCNSKVIYHHSTKGIIEI